MIRIGVVGNCVAGKSTLVSALKDRGYTAVNIAQEHSVSKRFWRRLAPDFLIYLHCSLSVAHQRRKFQWGQELLDQQWEVLSEARENTNLFIDTDPLSKEQVLERAIQAIEAFIGARS